MNIMVDIGFVKFVTNMENRSALKSHMSSFNYVAARSRLRNRQNVCINTLRNLLNDELIYP